MSQSYPQCKLQFALVNSFMLRCQRVLHRQGVETNFSSNKISLMILVFIFTRFKKPLLSVVLVISRKPGHICGRPSRQYVLLCR